MKRLFAAVMVVFILLCCGCGRASEPLTTTTIAPDAAVCTVSIACPTLPGNDAVPPEKQPFVPVDGWILRETEMEVYAGETVQDILRRVCSEYSCSAGCEYCNAGIALDASVTPGSGSYYVRGIHQLYEKDCGDLSGWMFLVNGDFPTVGAGECIVQNGDSIEWVYTCDYNESF